jgi:hypothetical protein
MTAFVSGHTDLTKEEFLQHYVPQLDSAIIQKCHFVLGNARGADQLALNYLLDRNVDPSTIVLYCYPSLTSEEKARVLGSQAGIKIIEGFPSYNQRDSAMTRASTHDIAWVRTETFEESKQRYGEKFNPKRISATQTNLNRRAKLNKSVS